MSRKTEAFSNSDLYVYNLQPNVVESLKVLYFSSGEFAPQLTAESLETHVQMDQSKTETGRKQCASCLFELESLSDGEIRQHYKSDLHRFNIKRRNLQRPPLSEVEFDKIADTLDESISGSDSDDDLDVKEVAKSVQKLQVVDEDEESYSFMNTRSPFIIFASPLLPEDKCFGVYKSLFSESELQGIPEQALKSWNQKQNKLGEISAVFMIGGGHFAAAIISHKPKSTKGNSGPADLLLEQSVDLIEHKTFHRYTTRRKQGGSQSAMDSAKGKAHSAGSTLRRYNEEALQKDVRDLMVSWKAYLDKCTSIFIRANGPTARGIIVGYDGSPIKNKDPRLRSFPFTTKRATTSELKRAWVNLTYMVVLDVPKSDEKRKQRLLKERESLLKSTQTGRQSPVKVELSVDEKHTAEIAGFIKKSKSPALISYMKKNAISPEFQLKPESLYHNTPTMLQFAAANGSAHIVRTLLTNLKADATAKNQSGRTAYDLCLNKATKQVFQIARNDLGESFCDWAEAHVDQPLSKEEVDKANREAKEEEERQKQDLIKEELAKKALEDEENRKAKFGPPKVLVGASLSQINLQSLTPEQRMKVMREQRARAAEARMKKN
ncbi:unnamed protein product [Kuraishia capsulata CBS 1993]|uniref:VLRF1 domain-containing protein n=1 Tax=Kuraishia capsulata CBS 1993 TaxID=1382522 RepID=W6MJI4_9ASCO|nr:uncharacterized protein KUCA_T00002408001 [Kuraishia capsulata CBS 1993]CDK26436.1 unnamed protein product [Kuraishia capsulata CBS 1993]